MSETAKTEQDPKTTEQPAKEATKTETEPKKEPIVSNPVAGGSSEVINQIDLALSNLPESVKNELASVVQMYYFTREKWGKFFLAANKAVFEQLHRKILDEFEKYQIEVNEIKKDVSETSEAFMLALQRFPDDVKEKVEKVKKDLQQEFDDEIQDAKDVSRDAQNKIEAIDKRLGSIEEQITTIVIQLAVLQPIFSSMGEKFIAISKDINRYSKQPETPEKEQTTTPPAEEPKPQTEPQNTKVTEEPKPKTEDPKEKAPEQQPKK